MKLAFVIVILLQFSNSVRAQEFTKLTGFGINTSGDKYIHDIQRLDDNTALIYFHEPKMLWRSDGTEAGTYLLYNWDTLAYPFINQFGTILGVVNGKAIMEVVTKKEGRELWVSDGTVSGTHLIVDHIAGSTGLDNDKSETKKFVTDGDYCYLLFKENNKWHIMRTNGTLSGTEVFAKDLIDNGFSNIDAPNLFLIDDNFYCMFFDTIYQLNKNTKTVKVFPCAPFYKMKDVEKINDSTLLIDALDAGYGAIITLNLNTNKIIKLTETNYTLDYNDYGVYSKVFKKFNNRFYFSQSKEFKDQYVFSTDGTSNGTKFIKTLEYSTREFIEYGDKLWFENVDGYYSIFSIDKSNKCKAELSTEWLFPGDYKSFLLLDNNKFFVAAPFPKTNFEGEPQFYDPANKSLTKVIDLNTEQSYPKMVTKLKDNTYLFYARDNEFEGALYKMVLGTSAVEESPLQNSIIVSPTVTSNSWYINAADLEFKTDFALLDILGNIKMTGTVDKEKNEIDGSKLSKGVYFLTFGFNKQTIKLVRQ